MNRVEEAKDVRAGAAALFVVVVVLMSQIP
jgi:hypothetical protein